MESSGSDDPLLIAVGEAPGADEDDQGVPFVGRSGKLLRKALGELLEDDPEKYVRFTNVVRCRPPSNKITAKSINFCKGFALDDIKKYSPDVVLLFGNSPLKAVLGKTGITNWNGVVVREDEAVYIPLFHPAYILRNSSAMDDWLEGMAQAVEIMLGEEEIEEVPDPIYEFPTTAWDLLEMKDSLATKEWIAYDTETNTLDPADENAKIVAISISDGEITYAFPVDHPESHWTIGDEKVLKKAVKDILLGHDEKIIGHNLKFDLKHTINHFGFAFMSGGDSMLASHMIDSRKGIHSLKQQAGKRLGMYDYDRELQDYIVDNPKANPKKGGNYGNIPLTILLPYAAMDADATFRLYKLLYGMLSDKQKVFYDEVLIPASDVLAHMEYTGITVDSYIADRYKKIYEMRQEELYEEILEDHLMSEAVGILQDRSDKKMILSMYPYELTDAKTVELYDGNHSANFYEITEDRIKYDDGDMKRNRKRPIIFFNPNSAHHLRVLYFEVYGMPIHKETESGLPSTDKEALIPLLKDYPIVVKIRYFKILGKAVSTYLKPALEKWASSDGKARSTFNLHGTITGRTSSTNPNFQNIPTPDKEPGTLLEHLPVKNIFKTSFDDGFIISVDYAGMELRVFASLAKCEEMLDIHRGGWDFHSMIASRITGIRYQDIAKPLRKKFKNVNFAMLYRGNEYTLHNKFGIPLDEAKRAIDDYNEELPEIEEFAQDCIEFATEHRYIESPFGRREALLDIGDTSEENRGTRNQQIRYAVNMPISSAASDILLCAMVILDELMFGKKLRARIINIVHDSIVIDAPRDEVDTVVSMCVDVMENIIEYVKKYMPNIDLSWLISPLKADVEIGTHYGTEISYGEWREEQNVL